MAPPKWGGGKGYHQCRERSLSRILARTHRTGPMEALMASRHQLRSSFLALAAFVSLTSLLLPFY
jgi:hypothetical protein